MYTRRFSIRYLSWTALAIAVALWVGVGVFFLILSKAEAERTERMVLTEQELTQQSTKLHLRTLARETSDDRAELENIARKDVVELLTAIEQAGRDAGISLDISGAVSTPTSNLALPAHVIALTVSMEGTFAQVTKAIALLEVLPVPSSVNMIRLDLVPLDTVSARSRSSTVWQAVVETRFLTTATLSS